MAKIFDTKKRIDDHAALTNSHGVTTIAGMRDVINANAKGAGYRFDGVNDNIEKSILPSFNPTKGFTVVAVINSESGNSADIISQYTGGAGENRQWVLQTNSGQFRLLGYSDGITTTSSPQSPMTLGMWYHVAGYYEPSNQKLGLYVNGVEIGTPTTLTSIIDKGQPICLGASVNIGYFNGTINQAHIYNRVLSTAEIKALSSGAPVDFADIGANETELTSGTLTIGKRYRLKDFIAGDDFSNIGATNVDGNEFIATGATPTTWTNSSIVVQIGCVLQLEQDAIGHNQWQDKSGNENHGTVSGATPINLNPNHIEKYRHTVAMTDDTAWADIIPAGYELEKIVFEESAGNAATLDFGTTSGASDIFKNKVIAASTITTVVLNKAFSMSATQSLFLNDDDAGSSWNSGSLTATVFMRRVI